MSNPIIVNPNNQNQPMPQFGGGPTSIFGDVTIVSTHQYINPAGQGGMAGFGAMADIMNKMGQLMLMKNAIELEAAALKLEQAKQSNNLLENPQHAAPLIEEKKTKVISFNKNDVVDATVCEKDDGKIEVTINDPTSSSQKTTTSPANEYLSVKTYLSMLEECCWNKFVQETPKSPVLLTVDVSNCKNPDIWKKVFKTKLAKYKSSVIKDKSVKITDATEFVVIAIDKEAIYINAIQKAPKIDDDADTLVKKYENYEFLKGFKNWLTDINDDESIKDYVDNKGRGAAFTINSYSEIPMLLGGGIFPTECGIMVDTIADINVES